MDETCNIEAKRSVYKILVGKLDGMISPGTPRILRDILKPFMHIDACLVLGRSNFFFFFKICVSITSLQHKVLKASGSVHPMLSSFW